MSCEVTLNVWWMYGWQEKRCDDLYGEKLEGTFIPQDIYLSRCSSASVGVVDQKVSNCRKQTAKPACKCMVESQCSSFTAVGRRMHDEETVQFTQSTISMDRG